MEFLKGFKLLASKSRKKKETTEKSKPSNIATNLKLFLRSHFFPGTFEFIVNLNCTIKDIKLYAIRTYYHNLIQTNESILEQLNNYHRLLGPKKTNNFTCCYLREKLTVAEAGLENNDELYLVKILPAVKNVNKLKNIHDLDTDNVQDQKLETEIEKRLQKVDKRKRKQNPNVLTSERLQELQLPEFSSEVRRLITPFLELVIIVLSNMQDYPKAKRALEIFRTEILKTLFPGPLNQAYIIEFRDRGYSTKRTKYAFYHNKNRPSEAIAWLERNVSLASIDIPDDSFQIEDDMKKFRLLSTSSLTDTSLLLKLFKDYRAYTFKPDLVAFNCLMDFGYSKTEITEALQKTENSYSSAFRVLSNETSRSLTNMDSIPYPNRIYKSICEKILKLHMFDAKVLIALLGFYKAPEEIIFGWCFDHEAAPVIFEMFELYQFETQDIYHCAKKYVSRPSEASCSRN